MVNNIKNLLIKSLNKTGKQNQIISSIIWSSIINDFKELKKLDIKKYLISIKLKNNTVFIKTNSPILNNEISNIEDILINNLNKKITDIGIKIKINNLILK